MKLDIQNDLGNALDRLQRSLAKDRAEIALLGEELKKERKLLEGLERDCPKLSRKLNR